MRIKHEQKVYYINPDGELRENIKGQNGERNRGKSGNLGTEF
jgi:hypothetical protein